jgi:hypothetical protein
MKVAVIGGIAFAVGLAGGTGIGMRGGSAPASADSTKTHADSGAVKPDSLAGEHAPDSATVKPPAAADTAKHEAAPAATPEHAPTAAPATSAPAPVDPSFDPRQLADALGKLAPADAAPLLGRFSDEEILATVKLLGMAKAGVIISKLPEPRSTKLSRRLLLELGTGGRK